MNDLIQCGLPYRSGPGADFRLRHLRDQGVTGREALEIVGGVWLLSRREHRILPDDERLTYHLGLALFRARPYPQRVSFARGQERTHYLPPGSHARRAVGDRRADRTHRATPHAEPARHHCEDNWWTTNHGQGNC